MDNFFELKEWFEKKGGFLIQGIDQRETEFGAGLVTTRDLTEG